MNFSLGLPSAWPGSEDAANIGDSHRSEWDVLRIGGVPVPGLTSIQGEIGSHVQTRQAPGTDGATTTFINYKLAEFEARVRMWTSLHFEAWASLMVQIQPRPGPLTKKAWGIYHPALSVHGIDKAVVLRVGVPTRGTSREIDVWTATIHLREFRPGKKSAAQQTPTSAQQEPTLRPSFQTAADADTDAPSKTQTGP